MSEVYIASLRTETHRFVILPFEAFVSNFKALWTLFADATFRLFAAP